MRFSDTGIDPWILLGRLPEAVIVNSATNQVFYVNVCGCRMFGMAPEARFGLEIKIPELIRRSSSLMLSLGGQPRPIKVLALPLEMTPGCPVVAVVCDALRCATLGKEILDSLLRDELTGLLKRRGLKYATEQIQADRAGDPAC